MKTFLDILYIILGYICIAVFGTLFILLIPILLPAALICAVFDNTTIKESVDNEGSKKL